MTIGPLKGRPPGMGEEEEEGAWRRGDRKRTSEDDYLDWTYPYTGHPVFLDKHVVVYIMIVVHPHPGPCPKLTVLEVLVVGGLLLPGSVFLLGAQLVKLNLTIVFYRRGPSPLGVFEKCIFFF